MLVFQKEDKKYVIFNFYSDAITEENFKKYNLKFDLYRVHQSRVDTGKECSVINSNYHDPAEKERWIEQVSSALNQIKAGDYHKIVLSRQVISELNNEPDFSFIMGELERKFPRCYVFAFRKSESVFFGASPEKLAKISGGWVEADALAGSIRRGRTESEDDELANELLHRSWR